MSKNLKDKMKTKVTKVTKLSKKKLIKVGWYVVSTSEYNAWAVRPVKGKVISIANKDGTGIEYEWSVLTVKGDFGLEHISEYWVKPLFGRAHKFVESCRRKHVKAA